RCGNETSLQRACNLGGPRRASLPTPAVLANLRKYSSSRGVKILYALLAVSFIGWGVGATRQAHLDVVARVHGQRITRHELDAQTTALQNRFQELMKGATGPQARMLRGQAPGPPVGNTPLRPEAHPPRPA